MRKAYGRVYTSLFHRSLRGKGALVISVMSYVIAHQVPESRDPDAPMIVDLNPDEIKDCIGKCSVEEVQAEIDFLCSEDKATSTPGDGGRRIVPIEGERYMYRVVNGRHYRDLADAEKRKEINRRAQSKKRAKIRSAELPPAGASEYMEAWEHAANKARLDEIYERWLPNGRRVKRSKALKGEVAGTRAEAIGDQDGADRIAEDTLPKGAKK
jgi:hypothetical protein